MPWMTRLCSWTACNVKEISQERPEVEFERMAAMFSTILGTMVIGGTLGGMLGGAVATVTGAVAVETGAAIGTITGIGVGATVGYVETMQEFAY